MGSRPTCPQWWWCEPRPRTVGQGHAPPCRSRRTGSHGKGSRTCWRPCSMERRNQGECTRTGERSPWCCPGWRSGRRARPSIPAPAHGRCPYGPSPRPPGSRDCHRHLPQAAHHRHHLPQEARSTRGSSPKPPRRGCRRWSPGRSSSAVGASVQTTPGPGDKKPGWSKDNEVKIFHNVIERCAQPMYLSRITKWIEMGLQTHKEVPNSSRNTGLLRILGAVSLTLLPNSRYKVFKNQMICYIILYLPNLITWNWQLWYSTSYQDNTTI